MERKNILLTGTNRKDPANLVADGSAREIINLRPKNGAYRPVGTKTAGLSVAGDIHYIHEIDDRYMAVIFYDSTAEVWKYTVYDNNVSNAAQTLTGLTSPTLKTISSLNSTLVIVLETAGVMSSHKLVFDKDTEIYRVFGSLPAVPFCSLSSEAVTADDENTLMDITVTEITDSVLTLLKKMMDTEHGDEYYTGPILVMLAWEMIDGSEIKQSIPIWWTGSYMSVESAGSTEIARFMWKAYKLRLTCSMSANDLDNISETYKGIISGLVIYATKMQEPKKGEVVLDVDGHIIMSLLLPVFPSYSPETLKDESLFYLVKKIPISELSATLHPSGTDGYVLEGPFNDLSSRDSLGINQSSHHDLAFNGSFSYNSRLFGSDTQTKLFAGFLLDGYINGSLSETGGNSYYLGAEIDINTSAGVKTVFTGWGSALNYYSSSSYSIIQFFFNKFYGYPDSRATTLRLFCKNNLGVIYKLRTYPMVRIESFNYSVMVGGYETLLSYSLSSLTPTALTTVDDTYRDANRVQATGMDNIFVYPAENSYRIGNGNILGLSTNAVALSSGQFGEYPLYCFTTDGVWAMASGNGDILIESIRPLLRDVCSNPASLLQIDGGVVYATTKGLMLLSGSSAVELSAQAEGKYVSPLKDLVSYSEATSDANIAQLSEYLCATDILTFLSGAKFGYDHIEGEIICSNPSYAYSWVFNLEFKAWHKISESFAGFVNRFPVCYGKRNGTGTQSLYALSSETFSGDISVLFETREVKFTGGGYKKIIRSLLGCFVSHASIDNRVSIQVYGSPDTQSWYRLSCSNVFGKLSDLLLGRSSFSCKQFIYLITGRVAEDSSFTHVEADLDTRYSSKLR